MFKSRKSKNDKLLKSRNLSNFDAIKAGPSFLTLNAKTTLNHSWLAFIKIPIFYHFDPKYYIQIETDIIGYAIGEVLN